MSQGASNGMGSSRALRLFSVAAVVAGAALVYAPTLGHIDFSDSFIYTAIVRGLIEDHSWLEPRYLDGPYRDHLPFGFWPLVVVARLAGERAMLWFDTACSVATLLIVWTAARRLAGEASAALAVLVLGTTESFFLYGGRVLLDPQIVLWSTLGAVVVLTARLGPGTWAAAWGCAALGALVKGPFGPVMICAAALARAAVDRSWRSAVIGVAVSALALVPPAGFLLFDLWWGHHGWWDGYVHHQLLLSALGQRADGTTNILFPIQDLVGRFWPGVPLVAVAFVQAAVLLVRRVRSPDRTETARDRALLLLALFSAIAIGILLLPRRKVWNHLLIVYPALALAAGAAGGPWLERLFELPRVRRGAVVAMATASALTVVGSVSGWLAPRLLLPPCVFSRTLRPPLAGHAGEHVLFTSLPTSWRAVGELVVELRLDVRLVPALPVGDAIARDPKMNEARLAVADARRLPGDVRPWRQVAAADGWVVLERP